jgi:uncharacterized paraquat-inducible protein A
MTGYTVMRDKKRVCISCGLEDPSRKDRCPKCGCYAFTKMRNGDLLMRFAHSGENIGHRKEYEE